MQTSGGETPTNADSPFSRSCDRCPCSGCAWCTWPCGQVSNKLLHCVNHLQVYLFEFGLPMYKQYGSEIPLNVTEFFWLFLTIGAVILHDRIQSLYLYIFFMLKLTAVLNSYFYRQYKHLVTTQLIYSETSIHVKLSYVVTHIICHMSQRFV